MKRKSTAAPKKTTMTTKRVRTDYNVGRTHPSQPKAELKAFDTAQAQSVFATPANFTALNVPVTGTDYFNRIGRKIYMKNVHIRGVVNNLATSTTQEMVRMLIVYDSQPNTAFPVIADILQNANVAAATSVSSDINLVNRERFTILRDKQIIVYPVTNTAGALTNLTIPDPIAQTYNINEFVKLKGLETTYNVTSGGTIADVTSGSLLFVTFGASGAWQINFHSRLRFYD